VPLTSVRAGRQLTGTQGATSRASGGWPDGGECRSGHWWANRATNENVPKNTIVKRDATGGFTARNISATNVEANGAEPHELNAEPATSGPGAEGDAAACSVGPNKNRE